MKNSHVQVYQNLYYSGHLGTRKYGDACTMTSILEQNVLVTTNENVQLKDDLSINSVVNAILSIIFKHKSKTKGE